MPPCLLTNYSPHVSSPVVNISPSPLVVISFQAGAMLIIFSPNNLPNKETVLNFEEAGYPIQ